MSRTSLITGGAGFIGSALVRELAARGERVVVVDALTYAGHPQNLAGVPGEVSLVQADIAEGERIAALLDEHRPYAVYHLAAESHVDNSIAAPGAFIRTNVSGTCALLEAALRYWKTLAGEAKERFRFVQVSTDEVYGALGEEGVFTPDTPLAPNSPYSASKAAGDLFARAWWRTYGLPVITTRTSNNYGPRQHPEKLIPHMITQALVGKPLPIYGKGMQVRDWIHVSDHARGIIAACERGETGGTYLFGGHEERRNRAVVEAICDILARLRPGPDYRALMTEVPDRLGHDFRYAIDDAHSTAALCWKREVTDFEQGLEETVRWYLENTAWVQTMREHGKK